jgi:hemolysin activation/secretion protein/AraC-like DNA-binding protein
MTVERHLLLQELIVLPSAEWFTRAEGWVIARAAEGTGYWLNQNSAQELNSGDMLVTPRNSSGLLRASSLGSLKLQFFFIQPRLLNGLLPLADGQQLDTATISKPQAVIWPAREPLAKKFTEIASQPPGNALSLRCRLLQLWADSVANLVRQPVEPTDAGDLRERFRQLLGQMSQAEWSACSLGDIAGQLHCSERHLSRLFREEFGIPFRERQTELRLTRACQILADSNAKIIHVAYESGYRHLGLFNTMFKKRFGMTPSEWRQKAAKKNNKLNGFASGLIFLLAMMNPVLAAETNAIPPRPAPEFHYGTPVSDEAIAKARETLHKKISELNAQEHRRPRTNQTPVDPTQPKFQVEHYDVRGNTLLKPEILDVIFTDAKGTNVSLSQIRDALADLQLEYRERGFATVAVTLPQQQITNATVAVQVTEAPIASINVLNNHHYSSNNIMRALPSLHTNMLLNSQVFQRELDLANANRDRQIYPIVGPGAEPGTSDLTLKVKDRFPLHSRLEVNNQYTPGTPYLRVNLNAQYNNLWDRDHQVGLQYSFTPTDFKSSTLHKTTFFDNPMIANYSAYYRMPLGTPLSVQEQINADSLNFGYSEVTHQFRLPPVSGRPELNFYASRSTTDTGIKLLPRHLVTQTSFITIVSQDSGEDVTLNEGFGSALSLPLPEKMGIRSTLTLGVDFKRFRLASFNTNNFYITTVITNASGSQTIENTVSSGQPMRIQTVDYLPFNISLDLARPDKWGATLFNASVGFNVLPGFSGDKDFAQAAYNTNANSHYVKFNAGFSREQKIYKDWSVLLRGDGQWAHGPLIGNEQFAMGGLAGVRGYIDGEAYRDSGL